jgi:hypothetical protein
MMIPEHSPEPPAMTRLEEIAKRHAEAKAVPWGVRTGARLRADEALFHRHASADIGYLLKELEQSQKVGRRRQEDLTTVDVLMNKMQARLAKADAVGVAAMDFGSVVVPELRAKLVIELRQAVLAWFPGYEESHHA